MSGSSAWLIGKISTYPKSEHGSCQVFHSSISYDVDLLGAYMLALTVTTQGQIAISQWSHDLPEFQSFARGISGQRGRRGEPWSNVTFGGFGESIKRCAKRMPIIPGKLGQYSDKNERG